MQNGDGGGRGRMSGPVVDAKRRRQAAGVIDAYGERSSGFFTNAMAMEQRSKRVRTTSLAGRRGHSCFMDSSTGS